jgi:hypothetical protein
MAVLEMGSYGNQFVLHLTCKSVKKIEITVVGIRRADHATPLYPQKLALTSPISGGLSVGVVRLRTKATKLVNI